jgi:hypothetical protein
MGVGDGRGKGERDEEVAKKRRGGRGQVDGEICSF